MFQKIPFNHQIFTSQYFKKDEISFNLIPYLIKNKENFPSIRVYSDTQSVIILNTDINNPIIVWTRDDFFDFEQLYAFLNATFSENTHFNVMTKNSYYQFFLKKNLVPHATETRISGVYRCSQLNPVPEVGYLDHAKPEEKNSLIQILRDFYAEALPDDSHSPSHFEAQANNFIQNPETHKVWRNASHQITTIGRIEIVNTHARVGRIYTIPEYRGHSYAKMIVQNLTQIAFKKQLTPVLYTNFKYEPSNKCYQAIGFELIETVFTYELKK